MRGDMRKENRDESQNRISRQGNFFSGLIQMSTPRSYKCLAWHSPARKCTHLASLKQDFGMMTGQIISQSPPPRWHSAMPQRWSYPGLNIVQVSSTGPILHGILPAITRSDHYSENWVTNSASQQTYAVKRNCKQGHSWCGTGKKKYW